MAMTKLVAELTREVITESMPMGVKIVIAILTHLVEQVSEDKNEIDRIGQDLAKLN